MWGVEVASCTLIWALHCIKPVEFSQVHPGLVQVPL